MILSEGREEQMSKPLLIGITGGTGSGKSTVARAIYESLPKSNISIIEQDSYYKDQSHLSSEERIKTIPLLLIQICWFHI